MKRPRPHDKSLSREAEKLVHLAQDLSRSGSRLEDAYWDRALSTAIEKLLAAGNDDALFAALDHALTLIAWPTMSWPMRWKPVPKVPRATPCCLLRRFWPGRVFPSRPVCCVRIC
jgi:hypothetical protein